MISFTFIFLFATVFSASVSNVRCESNSDVFVTVFSRAMSTVNAAATNASAALSGMSPQDPDSVDSFQDSFNNLVDVVTPGFLNISLNQPPSKLNDTQFQQLSVQLAGYSSSIIDLAQTVLAKQEDINSTNDTCFAQAVALDVEVNAVSLLVPIVPVSPKPGEVALNMTRVLANLILAQNLPCIPVG